MRLPGVGKTVRSAARTRRPATHLGLLSNKSLGKRLELLAAVAQLLPGLLERNVERPELPSALLDAVVDARMAKLLIPAVRRHARLKERVQHIAVQERGRRAAQHADELLQDGLARAVRRVGDFGRRDEDVGVQDEEAGRARERDGQVGGGGGDVG